MAVKNIGVHITQDAKQVVHQLGWPVVAKVMDGKDLLHMDPLGQRESFQ